MKNNHLKIMDTSKEIEKFFVQKTKQAILEGWKCRSCHQPVTKKISFTFPLKDYLKDGVLEVKHQYCA